jgi:hypothetical protein
MDADTRISNGLTAYEAWRIRCCGPEDFIPWFIGATAFKTWKVYRSKFCEEANANWCLDRQLAGQCAVLDTMPELPGDGGKAVLQPHALATAQSLVDMCSMRKRMGHSA